MKEILFRGKQKDNGEWVEGFYGHSGDKTYIIFDNGFALSYFRMKEVIPESVGQYTGLTDKNRKKIFEGDIVLYCGEKRKVYYTNGQFGLFIDGNIFDSFNFAFPYQLEIIGNIHDNPELLEVEEK